MLVSSKLRVLECGCGWVCELISDGLKVFRKNDTLLIYMFVYL